MARRLSILALGIVLISLSGPALSADKEGEGATKLDGAWRMVSPELPDGIDHIKLVAGGRFVWTTAQGGKILRSAGGKCQVEGDTYKEIIEHVLGEDVGALQGKVGTFTWKLEEGRWIHKGVVKTDQGDLTIDEVWERVKK